MFEAEGGGPPGLHDDVVLIGCCLRPYAGWILAETKRAQYLAGPGQLPGASRFPAKEEGEYHDKGHKHVGHAIAKVHDNTCVRPEE